MAIKLTKQQQQTLAAVVIGVGAFLYCYIQFFCLPVYKKMVSVNAELENLSKQIAVADGQAKRLPELIKELADLNIRMTEAEKSLPKTKSVPDILVALSALGEKHEVSLLSFAPGAVKPQTYYIELHFPITMRGSFHSLGLFLADLALQQRLYNVFNINFPGTADDTGRMQVTFDLVSYQYKG
jgi:type IV pilus assembly protein PilO